MSMDPTELARLEKVEAFMRALGAAASIPKDVDGAFRARFLADFPEGIFDAPLGSISNPTGGLTVDAQARSAINSIITRLEDLGLIES